MVELGYTDKRSMKAGGFEKRVAHSWYVAAMDSHRYTREFFLELLAAAAKGDENGSSHVRDYFRSRESHLETEIFRDWSKEDAANRAGISMELVEHFSSRRSCRISIAESLNDGTP